MKNLKKLSLILLLAAAILLSACSASGNFAANDSLKSESLTDYMEGTPSEKDYSTAPESGMNTDTSVLADRKIVKTVTLTAETKAFDEATAHIRESVAALGGYIEASNIKGNSIYNQSGIVRRTASFTLRIPADKLDEYVADVKGRVNIVSQRENIDDITDSYFDVDARLNSLKIEEERLLEMLEESNDLEYLIRLNERLAEVRYDIESYTSTIRRYDNMVSYSTVNITLEEVIDYTVVTDTPKTFGERLGIAFTESWHNFVTGLSDFAIELVYAAPALILLAIITVIIVIVVKKVIKKVKKSMLDEQNKNRE